MNNINDKLTNFYANNIINQTPYNKPETLVPYTRYIVQYLKADALHHPSTNMGPPIYVICSNSQIMQSDKTCLLDFPSLPDESCEGHILPILIHIPLVSMEKLCDAGCKAVFKSQEVIIKRNKNI